MNESTPIKEDRMAALSGLGTSRKRVEDARFTQGKGNYVDDLKLLIETNNFMKFDKTNGLLN